MKKGSNPSPPIVSISREHVARVFDEWQKRYAENPSEFGEILDEKGKPIAEYGEKCAIYFEKLAIELKDNLPPLNNMKHVIELNISIEKTEKASVFSKVCEHIYGHSETWDRLLYELDDEKKCLSDYQDDSAYQYTMFEYCPKCGIKLNR